MKIHVIATIGVIMIITGLGLQMIQYQKQIDDLNKRLDTLAIENIKLREQNDRLWSIYYQEEYYNCK